MIDLLTKWFKGQSYSDVKRERDTYKSEKDQALEDIAGAHQLLIDREKEVNDLTERLDTFKELHGEKTSLALQYHEHITKLCEKARKLFKNKDRSKPRRREAMQQLRNTVENIEQELNEEEPRLVQPPQKPEHHETLEVEEQSVVNGGER